MSATPDWLWPFLLTAMVLVGAFCATLVWAVSPRATAAPAAPPAPDAAQAAQPPPAGLGRPALLALWVGAPLAVILLYALLGHPRALNPQERISPTTQINDMVQRLAERLARQPDDPAGWLMLARSLKVTGRMAEAAQAYGRAGERARKDPDLLADWIEARILADEQHFDELSLGLLTQAIALAPRHPKILLLHGLAALDLEDPVTARQAFAVLRELHAPGSPDRQALDIAIQRIDRGEDPRVAASAPAQ